MYLAFGEPLGGGEAQDIELSPTDLSRSIYKIGSSGSGKSSGIETWAHQLVTAGDGFALIDVEDKLAPRVLAHLQDAGRTPVIIDPSNHTTPLNLLALHGQEPHMVVEAVLQTFERYWWASWGPRFEDIVRHTLLLLIEHNLTLGELPAVLSNRDLQKRMAEQSKEPRVRQFFLDHLTGITSREYRTWIEAVRNKAGALLANPRIAACLSHDDCLDFSALMDSRAAVIINLPERELGDSGRLIGSLLISRMFQGALRRTGTSPFALVIDEFQKVTSRSLVDLITRSRKRFVYCILAHQSVSQAPFDRLKDDLTTILNNVGTMVVMQVGYEDAKRFAPEIFPATGTQVKSRKTHWLWGDSGPIERYSIQEEREHQIAELERQHQREMFIKIKRNEGTEVFQAVAYDLPEPVSEYVPPAVEPLPPLRDRLACFSKKRRRVVDEGEMAGEPD